MNLLRTNIAGIGYLVSLIICFLISGSAFGQAEQEAAKGYVLKRDSIKQAELDARKIRITPFLAPSYTPETSVLFNLGGLISFNVQPDNPLVARSSIPFSIGYSINGSFFANIKAFVYGKNDKLRVSAELWLKDMPDNYWGVGYDNARNTEAGDSTSYHRQWLSIYVKTMHQFKPNLFFGPILNINRTIATDLNPKMQNDPNVLSNGTSIYNSGIGAAFSYDTRDVPLNAYKGMLVDVSMVFYGHILGGESNFATLQLDYRQYKKLKKRTVIAWQAKLNSTNLNTPWTDLSLLGTPFDLRAYNWGRYRDKSFVMGIVEYRHMFNRKKLNKKGNFDSRFGFVTWIGTGALGDNLGNLSHFIPAIGAGLRFEVQPRMNIRVDMGWGIDSNGFYISFNEAF